MSTQANSIEALANQEYKWGFVTDIAPSRFPKGRDGHHPECVSSSSARRASRNWMLEWRLKAYRHWLTMQEPTWAKVHYPPIDYQEIVYYSAPKPKRRAKSPWMKSIRSC